MSFLRNLVPALLLGTFSPVHADNPSFAVVDMTKVFSEHPATAESTRELTEAREASREEFKKQSNALKEILQRHQELIRAGDKKSAEEELKKANEAEKAIATLRTTGLRDLEEQFRKSKLSILGDIRDSIAEFNEDGRFVMIFDSSSASSNGLPQVVHAPGATDITDEVIAFVRKKATEEKEKKP